MNTHKNRIPVGVRDCDTRAQRNKNVAVSCHHNAVAVGLKDRSQSLRNVQVHRAFGNSLAGNTAAVVSAMTGIDDNDG